MKVLNETGIRILSLVDRINLFCTETPAQRQEREAREEKERENKRIEMEAAANAKAEKNRTAMLSDAKNAVKFWRSLVPRKCQFRCGERIMDEDYQYHITQVCEYREVRCHLGCNLKLRWRESRGIPVPSALNVQFAAIASHVTVYFQSKASRCARQAVP